MKTLAHGTVGGTMAKVNGGNFADGFWGAGLSQAFALADGYEKIGATDTPKHFWDVAYNGIAAGIDGEYSCRVDRFRHLFFLG